MQANGSLGNERTVNDRKKALMSVCKAKRLLSLWMNFNQVKHANVHLLLLPCQTIIAYNISECIVWSLYLKQIIFSMILSLPLR